MARGILAGADKTVTVSLFKPVTTKQGSNLSTTPVTLAYSGVKVVIFPTFDVLSPRVVGMADLDMSLTEDVIGMESSQECSSLWVYLVTASGDDREGVYYEIVGQAQNFKWRKCTRKCFRTRKVIKPPMVAA